MSIVFNQKVKIKWNHITENYYKTLGYIKKDGEKEFTVSISHLKETSRANVDLICDHCHILYQASFKPLCRTKNQFCSRDCQYSFSVGKSNARFERFSLECASCGTEVVKNQRDLDSYKNIFCSKKCSGDFQRGVKREEFKNGKDVNCFCCDNSFYLAMHRIESQERYFCTNECRIKWTKSDEFRLIISNVERDKVDRIVVSCDTCKNEFEKLPSEMRYDKNFCSEECRIVNFKLNNPNPLKEKIVKKCNKSNCTNTIEIHESMNQDDRVFFCSHQCYGEYRSEFFVGENSPSYGTKRTPEQIDNMRIAAAKRLSSGNYVNINSGIQQEVEKMIHALGYYFESEVPYKYYALDFCNQLEGLAIEVMGDWWHGSPLKYPDYESLYDLQKKGIKRDKAKKTYLSKYHNMNVLYLWEKDINDDPELCVSLIDLYVKNNGNIQDYNSFNYFLEDGKPLVKNEIILPYFDRINTEFQTLSV